MHRWGVSEDSQRAVEILSLHATQRAVEILSLHATYHLNPRPGASSI